MIVIATPTNPGMRYLQGISSYQGAGGKSSCMHAVIQNNVFELEERHCPKCGMKLPTHANFCQKCGARAPAQNPLEEYKEGNKFSQSYIRASWTATSIFLPVCFGLVAVSYTPEMLKLSGLSLFPLALASFSLFVVRWLYTNRYASYNRSIWKRLQDLELEAGMYLHLKIDIEERDRSIQWRIKHVNAFMLVLILTAWTIRIGISPISPFGVLGG